MVAKKMIFEGILIASFLYAFGFYCGYSIGARESRATIIDSQTRTKAERKPMMGEYKGKWYPVGTRLTGDESGNIIIADDDTPDDWIIYVVK